MSDAPDITGFKEAQAKLVSFLGSDVLFRFPPTSSSFASAVYVNPEEDASLDPLEGPYVEYVPASITVRATVIRRGPNAENQGVQTKFGIIPTGHVWLRIPEGTYDPAILNAHRVEIFDEQFRVERFIADGLDGGDDRLYVECVMVKDRLRSTPPGSASVLADGEVISTFTTASGQTIYTLPQPFVSGTTYVTLDGLTQAEGPLDDYIEVSPNQIQFNFTPAPGQSIIVVYEVL